MTNWRIRVDFAIAYNRSNGGVAFVFVKNFGCETRLEVCEHSKFFTSAKLHTPEQIAKPEINYTEYYNNALSLWLLRL